MSNELQRHRIEAGSKAPICHPSPLQYLGGKSRVCEKLWTVRPDDSTFSTFIDPFGGGASTPLTFVRSGDCSNKKFMIRDSFAPTILFWEVLQQSPRELAYAADDLFNNYPNGVDLEPACCAAIIDWQDSGNHSVQAAAAYYIHTHICHPHNQFNLTKSYFPHAMGNCWLESARFITGRLIQWSEMIQGWDFKVQDYKDTMAEAIALGDSAFCFIDPPYEETGKSDSPDILYGAAFGKEAHDHLADLVSKATANGVKAMITINSSDANKLRYANYHQFVRDQGYASTKKGTTAKKVSTEMVILTYEPPFFKQVIANTNWKLAPPTNDNQPLEISQGDCA